MISRINHIAVATENANEIVRQFSRIFGFLRETVSIDREQGFKSTRIRSNDVHIEIIEPIVPDSTISQFLKERGSGLHHVSFEVDDLEATLRSFENSDVRLINRIPYEVDDYKVVFIHPKSFGGILIELIEINDGCSRAGD